MRAVWAIVSLLPAVAAAHRGSVTYGQMTVEAKSIHYQLEILARDLVEPLGLSSPPSQAELSSQRARIARYVTQRVAVLNHQRSCVPALGSFDFVEKTDGFAIRLGWHFVCERRPEDIEIRYHLFFDLDPRHESYTTINLASTLQQHVFRQGARTLRLNRPVGALTYAGDYLLLGIEHIFTGYDHICFLIGLLLIAGIEGRSGVRRDLKQSFLYTLTIVTAFTVAHSITLIVAAQGHVRLPSRIVESAIALSIAYVGAENLVASQPRGRWLLTFGFGLIHGFGFAGVLADIGLPRQGLLLSLLSFNLGVELGQAASVAVIFPLLHWWAGRPSYRPVVLLGGSAAVTGLALLWFVERAFSIVAFGGRLG